LWWFARFAVCGQFARVGNPEILTNQKETYMKFAVVGAIVLVVIIALLLIAGEQQQAQPDPVAVLAGVDGLVETVVDSDVRWLQQLVLTWDVSNRNYLIMAMPYSLAMLAAGVLGFGLLVAVVVVLRRMP